MTNIPPELHEWFISKSSNDEYSSIVLYKDGKEVPPRFDIKSKYIRQGRIEIIKRCLNIMTESLQVDNLMPAPQPYGWSFDIVPVVAIPIPLCF